MEAQNLSSQDQDGLAGEVMESVGVPDGEKPQESEEASENEGSQSNESLAIQKRLKSQRRAHEREVRGLQARIGELEARMSQPTSSQDQTVNPYSNPQGAGIDEHIHKAVSIALQHKENEERKAREAQDRAQLHQEYQQFQKHLDGLSDKYDDFQDVVFGPQTPYTETMRDYALTLPRSGAGSAGEVLYKLGKNPEELQRIAKLPAYKQASEMAVLSHALINGGERKGSQTRPPLGNIKSNPVTNSHAVTEKTPIGSIRDRMKSGNWK